MSTTDPRKAPDFDFEVPPMYRWLIEKESVAFVESGPLEPWHFLDSSAVFEIAKKWPRGLFQKRLVAFARRQDCDDIACFEIRGSRAVSVVLIHGWTPEGYSVDAEYPTFREWLKAVVDDISGLAEHTDDPAS